MANFRAKGVTQSLTSRVPQPAARLAPPATPPKPKHPDRVRQALCACHYSHWTEEVYELRIKRFIVLHGKLHPMEMGEPGINAFLTHLAVKQRVSAWTQDQALSALLLLYRHVPGREVGELGKVIRARKSSRLSVVLTRDEVKAVLTRRHGDKGLIASLMYGAGLWLGATCHTLRHSFAAQIIEAGYDIRSVQELLGHKDVRTRMVYTHVLNRGGRGVKSPGDTL